MGKIKLLFEPLDNDQLAAVVNWVLKRYAQL